MTSYGVMLGPDDAPLAAPAGADHVDSPIAGVIVVTDDAGRWGANPAFRPVLPMPSCAILFPGKGFAVSDPASTPEELAAIEAYLETALAAVVAVAEPGASVVFGSGAARRLPEGTARADGVAAFARTVRMARDIAVRHGLRLLLEPLHRGETDLVNSIAEAADFLDQHGLSDVGIVADLFHVMLEEESFSTVEQLAGRVGQVHIADSGRVPPGQGDWPLAAFLEALRAGGYSGGVTIECHWSDVATELAPALAALRAVDAAGQTDTW